MSKQIVLGADKGPIRSTTADQVLVDVRGRELTDSAGNPLYTETDQISSNAFDKRKATSTHINNVAEEPVGPGKNTPIEEQFPSDSEVSASLLGIPRLGKQQSILADVSVYGIDENTWEFFRSPNPYQPIEWSERINPVYGKRFNPRLSEIADQQALALEAFPTPWTFPFGPRWEESGGRYNEVLFQRYAKFIEMGNLLYDEFVRLSELDPIYSSLKGFADTHFLPREWVENQNGSVVYNDNFSKALEYVERWTLSWMSIRDSATNPLVDPRDDITAEKKVITFARACEILRVSRNEFNLDTTLPGYSSSRYYYAQLQSKEAFRYQPGAISGFTFGIKVDNDEGTLSNRVEWGCANDTDQYMFQVTGSQLNIIRRSIFPLSEQSLNEMGLDSSDQNSVPSPNPFERAGNDLTADSDNPYASETVYETVISQDKFNGDPLDSSGNSGYNITPQQVTMYKIEFSWYGAIGAKFYAYVPIDNGEARWVLLHTMLIENMLETPSLKNPYMHFRYSIAIDNTQTLRKPIFLYKFGSSYYIDGVDEGTSTFNSYSVDEKSITSINSKPILGMQTKDRIVSSANISDESDIKATTINQKNFYIDSMRISSDISSRVDVLECEGCRNGFGHYYADSLVNGTSGKTGTFVFTALDKIQYTDGTLFVDEDAGSKIIASGIFCSYIYPDPSSAVEGGYTTALVYRRNGGSSGDPTAGGYASSSIISVDGEEFSPYAIVDGSVSAYEFEGRLSNYNDVISSSVPLNKQSIDFRFLNPVAKEDTGQWAEFAIGVTSKSPTVEDGVLLFDGEPLVLEDEAHLEFHPYSQSMNLNGIENGEQDERVGIIFEDDYRIPSPPGGNSGRCSTLRTRVNLFEISASYSTSVPGVTGSDNYIVFPSAPPVTLINGGEIATFQGNNYSRLLVGGNPVVFTSDVQISTFEGTDYYYATVSDVISSIPEDKIGLRVISLSGHNKTTSKVVNFSTFPLYVFFAMRDSSVINNVVVQESDGISFFSHTPEWLFGEDTNITPISIGSPTAPSGAQVIGSNEYVGSDGQYYSGGVSSSGSAPANFYENNRLDAVRVDDQLSLPLRPGNVKTSFFIGENETTEIDTKFVFGIDRYKLTKGAFNNKYLYINGRALEPGAGNLSISISGRDQ